MRHEDMTNFGGGMCNNVLLRGHFSRHIWELAPN